MLRPAALTSLCLFLGGLAVTVVLDRIDQHQQETLWRAQAVAEAERVGNELRYRVLRERASLVAAATLYSGSEHVTSAELQDSVEVIRRSRGSVRLPLIAWLTPGAAGWQIEQSSGPDGLLAAGTVLRGPAPLLRTLALARNAGPELQVGELFAHHDRSLLALAVTAPNAGVDGVLMEVIAFDELLGQVGMDQMRQGMNLRILHPALPEVDHARQPPLASEAEAHHRQTIDMGVYAWTLEWAFDRDFNGRLPPSRRLALWLGGLLVSMSLAYAFYRALDQKRRVESEVRKQRAELEATYAELHSAMQTLATQERMAALGQLVAGVAHELGSPIGNALLAATTVDARSRETLAELKRGQLRMSALVDQLEASGDAARLVEQNLERASELLHSFKQVAVDRASERRREFDLKTTLEEIVASLSPQMRGTPHRLELDAPTGLHLHSYPGPLGQIISNLVMNSLKHAFGNDRPGHIRIQAQALERERVRIVYTDDGSGIDEAVRARVFEPFFTTRLGSGGSGLGLHIVLNLARDVLGGDIRCIAARSGARFELDMPKVAPHATHGTSSG